MEHAKGRGKQNDIPSVDLVSSSLCPLLGRGLSVLLLKQLLKCDLIILLLLPLIFLILTRGNDGFLTVKYIFKRSNVWLLK